MTVRQSILRALLATVAFVAVVTNVNAQTLTTGDLTGTVADPTGAVIPGATVLDDTGGPS